MSDKNGKVNVFGLTLEKKADIVSATAFLISFILAMIQVKNALIGSEISFICPNSLAIFEFDCSSQNHMQMIIPLAFVNRGAPGHHGVVSNVEANLKIGSNTIEFQAHQVSEYNVRFTANKQEKDQPRACSSEYFERGAFSFEVQNNVTIFNVPAGGAEVKKIHFIPMIEYLSGGVAPKKNQSNMVDAATILAMLKDKEQINLHITANAENEININCRIGVSDQTGFRTYFKDWGWITPPIASCSKSSSQHSGGIGDFGGPGLRYISE